MEILARGSNANEPTACGVLPSRTVAADILSAVEGASCRPARAFERNAAAGSQHAHPPGWKPWLYGRQDARHYRQLVDAPSRTRARKLNLTRGSRSAWFVPMNDAIARHRSKVEQNPDNELARFSLGKALFDRDDFAAAREQLAVALAKKPAWMVVQILIARCDINLGDKAAARTGLERARDLARQQGHVGPLEQVEELLRGLK